MKRKVINEDILKLFGKTIEEVAKNLTKDAMKNKSDDLHRNVDFQNISCASKPYTMFHPDISLKEQKERHRYKQAEEYKKNNHGDHKLGEKRPK